LRREGTKKEAALFSLVDYLLHIAFMKRLLLFLLMTVCVGNEVVAQNSPCSALGQTPGSALPICGIKEYKQSTVTPCGNKKIPNLCSDPLIVDTNPFWYKFTCFNSGTLGLLITPVIISDDYDWELFDVTGLSPTAVFTNTDAFVAANWSGNLGKTGTSADALNLNECGGTDFPTFSAMPNIIQGHSYILLISHFTKENQSGYTLTFGGGTADITDPKVPLLESATGSCKGTDVFIKLNIGMKCSSIAADGSDFQLTSGNATVIGASSVLCNTGFNSDSIAVHFDSALPAGDYTISLKTGSDGNTLLDNCDNPMTPGSISFRVNEDVSAAFTYTLKEGCEIDTIDFAHDGAHNVNTWSWLLDEVTSSNQNPTVLYNTSGSKNAQLIVSNEFCSDTSSQSIPVPDKISAAIEAPEIICSTDEAIFTDESKGNINSWKWNFGNGTTSTRQNPDAFKYGYVNGEKTFLVSLEIATAVGCTDTASAHVVVVGNCNIVVPSAFTPNHDGKNDELYPTNAFNADNLNFRVFNRFGQVLFETKDWRNRWDGNVNGQPQPTGTYVWSLRYTLKATGRNYNLKGTTVLIR
jgi:gliding motility-associated-like protein